MVFLTAVQTTLPLAACGRQWTQQRITAMHIAEPARSPSPVPPALSPASPPTKRSKMPDPSAQLEPGPVQSDGSCGVTALRTGT